MLCLLTRSSNMDGGLWNACRWGDLPWVKKRVRSGVDPKTARYSNGSTPLHYACWYVPLWSSITHRLPLYSRVYYHTIWYYHGNPNVCMPVAERGMARDEGMPWYYTLYRLEYSWVGFHKLLDFAWSLFSPYPCSYGHRYLVGCLTSMIRLSTLSWMKQIIMLGWKYCRKVSSVLQK